MLDELVSVIETLQTRIRDHGNTLRQNETRTRAALIDPLLQALGWDVADPGLVTPEYRVDVGWADYALRGSGNSPAAIVEAKRLGAFVENHLSQAVGYCIEQGIAYAAVTDGEHWQMYRTFEQVPMEEKRVLDLHINNTPAHECALQLLLMWRPNLATGKAIQANEPVLVPVDVPDAKPPVALDVDKPSVSLVSDGWTSLREIQPVNNQPWRPSAIRLPDGSEKQINRWWHVPKEVSEYLVRTGKLTHDKCPVKEGKRADIVHSQPQPSKAGTLGHLHQLSNGLYIRKLTSGGGLIRNAKFLLKLFGEDESAVRLKPG